MLLVLYPSPYVMVFVVINIPSLIIINTQGQRWRRRGKNGLCHYTSAYIALTLNALMWFDVRITGCGCGCLYSINWTAVADQNRIALLAAAAQEERIALLTATAHQDRIPLLADRDNFHSCFNTICFCVLLLLLNLLCLQWLYYKTLYVPKL